MRNVTAFLAMAVYLATLPGFVFAADSTGISAESSQEASQTSFQDSTDQSTADTTDNSNGSCAEASQNSTAESSNQSTAETAGSSNVEASVVVAGIVIVGAVVAVGLTVGGIILTVHASRARSRDVVGLQDQIYYGDGKDYSRIISYFEISDRDLVQANDELVAAGFRVVDDQSAAEYVANLILKVSAKSPRIRAEKVELALAL